MARRVSGPALKVPGYPEKAPPGLKSQVAVSAPDLLLSAGETF